MDVRAHNYSSSSKQVHMYGGSLVKAGQAVGALGPGRRC